MEEQISVPARCELGGVLMKNRLAVRALHWTRSHEAPRVWCSTCQSYVSVPVCWVQAQQCVEWPGAFEDP